MAYAATGVARRGIAVVRRRTSLTERTARNALRKPRTRHRLKTRRPRRKKKGFPATDAARSSRIRCVIVVGIFHTLSTATSGTAGAATHQLIEMRRKARRTIVSAQPKRRNLLLLQSEHTRLWSNYH